ncbi:MFS transporter [Rhodococcus sp. KBS0724]|uniref:MFS transporter n=1 Tax=Rhodococcus sp. KBS0724 TaxID=1179674 RepID=UPI0011867920|nr:MFS transporter [Rhodococcus sp. KBS0724]TSD40382.1 MFS transporter [Rhodococcus sp. KBS0724]
MRFSQTKVVLTVLTVGIGSFTLLQSMVTPVLPDLQRELGATQSGASWIFIAYLLSAAVCTPIIGRAGDIWGRRRMLMACLAVIAIGAVLSSLATTMPLMIVGRAIQGMGGGMLPIAFGIIRSHFPPESVPGSIGLVASFSAVWAGFGVVIGGPLVENFDYRWLFWAPAILLVLSIGATFRWIPKSETPEGGRINLISALLMSAWMIPLLVASTNISSWGFANPSVLILFSISMISCCLWIGVELKSTNPLIDMRVMRIKNIWVANLASALFGAGLFGLMAVIPAYIQTPISEGYGLGLSPSGSGLVIFAQTVTMFIVGIFAGRVLVYFGSNKTLAGGSLICAVSLLFFGVGGDTIWKFVLILAVVGIGFSLAFTSMSNMVVSAAPSNQTSVASGMNVNFRNIGGALGTAAMVMVVSSGVSPGAAPKESNYISGFLMLASFLFIGATVSAISARRDRNQNEDSPTLSFSAVAVSAEKGEDRQR